MLFRIDAPKRSRTPNLLIRSQTLYPVELWAHIQFKKIINHLKTKSKIKKSGRQDSNLRPLGPKPSALPS